MEALNNSFRMRKIKFSDNFQIHSTLMKGMPNLKNN